MACSTHGLLVNPSLIDFLYEKLITAVPVTCAVVAIVRYSDSSIWLLAYCGICLLHAAHMYLQKCPSCTYYKTEARLHSCLWWRWLPKIRKQRSTAPPAYLKWYVPGAVLLITFFPVYWLRFQIELLVIYFLSWGVLFFGILKHECQRCTYFDCPNNGVSEERRKRHLASADSSHWT